MVELNELEVVKALKSISRGQSIASGSVDKACIDYLKRSCDYSKDGHLAKQLLCVVSQILDCS